MRRVTVVPPKQPQYALVASADGISLLRRNAKDLVAPDDVQRIGAGGALMDRLRFAIYAARVVWSPPMSDN